MNEPGSSASVARSTAAPQTSRGGSPLSFRRDPELPISARREEILASLEAHPVLIVAGETGSGKSTQLPQYCLELGRGTERRIAHTQPRRLAARALASRIAHELGQAVGATVGFRVRFADQVSEQTRLVLMTDGLLLAELGRDPRLERYDTVIVDEAHERSLNIDLLLGVLKRVRPLRPDLKIIVTSATLEVERIARFFDDAPVIAVSGRGHPIEVRHVESWSSGAGAESAQGSSEELDLPSAVLEAYRVIASEPGSLGRGDVLAFLPGEREIRDVAELLERECGAGVEVLPLYSRLTWEQQSRIFERGSRPRIVLATNVAETSVTVPGIRAVIDSGLARISRYSLRSRLQRLPIEPISRASAEQRKGRCGRIGPGLCLRLYSEADFEARPAFTEPEIRRTNLAALLLRLAADGLGEAEHFPFLDPPEARSLNDGYRLLQELEALDAERRITRRGEQMARLPLDPRLARALLESRRFKAEGELLAIVAGLSVPDPHQQGEESGAGDAGIAASLGEDARSEFLTLLRLWRAYRAKRTAGPRRELKRWCRSARLSLVRMSDWDDVFAQVADRAAEIGIRDARRPASYGAIHRSLLAGFSTMIGVRGDEGVYQGVRGLRFYVWPGSPLRRRRPRWVMATSIVETSRVFARRVAEVEPQWIEGAAHHLIQREYLEPDWDEEREEVVARERVTLLGLTLAAHRRVNYGPIAPEEAQRIFAREALVHGRLRRRPAWLQANDAAIAAAQRLEERLRVRDLLHPAETFVEHYAAALPRQVSSGATLEHFSRHLTSAQRTALALTPAQILARPPDPEALAARPETAVLSGLTVPIDYRFAPGEADDGATLRVPLLAVPNLTRPELDAAIPGLVAPRVEAMLRSLPKDARRRIIPVGETVSRYLAEPGAAADAEQLGAWLKKHLGVPGELLRFDRTQVPPHLVPRIAVELEGLEAESVSELKGLRRRAAAAARAELDRRAAAEHPEPWQRFEIADLPQSTRLTLATGELTVYPTLRLTQGALRVRFDWSLAEAERHLEEGAVQLARLRLEPQVRQLAQALGRETRLLLAAAPLVAGRQLIETILQRSVRAACFGDAPAPRSREAFERGVERGRADLHERADEVTGLLADWLEQARSVRRALEDPRAMRGHAGAAEETHAHLQRLFAPPLLATLAPDSLRQLPRYLKAEQRRWERLLARGREAPEILRELDHWTVRLAELEREVASEQRWLPELEALRVWIEEYRVSLYAQEIKTLGPVSAPRLEQRAAAVRAWLER
ncbi:MAG TPA: ATP-dependent RNA helicase HrpA [Steroidobacteraceae bacterium]|nr:ATP-dependent RNA helicase HrpA [Steroidobacteraceae bacterium]